MGNAVACTTNDANGSRASLAEMMNEEMMEDYVPGRHTLYMGNKNIPPIHLIPPETLKNIGYGKIWSQTDWLDYDRHPENSPVAFHKNVSDYFVILLNKPDLDRDSFLRIRAFLSGYHLYPRYSEPPDRPENKRQKNYYRVIWDILHTIPFFMKEYTQASVEALKVFFQDVAKTHPCNVCQVHMANHLTSNPYRGKTLATLCVWLCNFHNAVNTRTGKPWFDCKKYARRWGPNMLPLPKRLENEQRGSAKSHRSVPSNAMSLDEEYSSLSIPPAVAGVSRVAPIRTDRSSLQPLIPWNSTPQTSKRTNDGVTPRSDSGTYTYGAYAGGGGAGGISNHYSRRSTEEAKSASAHSRRDLSANIYSERSESSVRTIDDVPMFPGSDRLPSRKKEMKDKYDLSVGGGPGKPPLVPNTSSLMYSERGAPMSREPRAYQEYRNN